MLVKNRKRWYQHEADSGDNVDEVNVGRCRRDYLAVTFCVGNPFTHMHWVGDDGRTAARLKIEYDLDITQRLVLKLTSRVASRPMSGMSMIAALPHRRFSRVRPANRPSITVSRRACHSSSDPRNTMKRISTAAGIVALLIADGAQAHAHLRTSDPQEGAVLAPTTRSISLTFSESARITAVFLQKDQEAKQALDAPSTTGETIGVALPALKPGAYTLTWRVLSTDDHHILSGQLHFKVNPTPP